MSTDPTTAPDPTPAPEMAQDIQEPMITLPLLAVLTVYNAANFGIHKGAYASLGPQGLHDLTGALLALNAVLVKIPNVSTL